MTPCPILRLRVAQLVGDGTGGTGQASFRQAFIAPLTGQVLNIVDQDLLDTTRPRGQSSYDRIHLSCDGHQPLGHR